MPEFGPSAQNSDNSGAASARLINCYRQPVVGGGRSGALLRSVLGTEDFASIGRVFFGAAYEFRGDVYATYDEELVKIDTTGSVEELGSVSIGDTSISSNNSYLTIASGGTYFTYQGAVEARSVQSLSAAGSVSYLDQYTLVSERGGRKWAWSELADPTTFPALNFATAEATDGDLLRVVGMNGRVILFKEAGREIWSNTGRSGADAFRRLPGGARDTGLKGYNLLTRTDEALFYIGSDNIARLTSDGYNEQRLSYPPVDQAIAQSNPTECFYYEDDGQKFCVVRFSDRPAWILDLATMEWHERAEGPDHEAWTARGTVKRGDTWYAFTNEGEMRKLTRNNLDGTGVLKRTAVSSTFYAEEGATLDELEIYLNTGFQNLGRNAEIWIRLSRDGGHTWTLEKWREVGTTGGYRKKATWRALGRFEQLAIEANISEPADIPVWASFHLEAA